ncbi:OsmC family protein [Albibacterium bauzanense]|uniref:Putative OsmC-like protein n=1 Tax=Albibacterium bauzanense TaxID=653929 RepID=A0A4R1LZP5_9SPHI|nr:OsmC family protein [Albibacterium bauzanense]TCK82719.1 putative OsmC-like protein [Albibacterium bauzanense]
MATIRNEYLGELRTRATHLKSGNSIITDAPVDNQGKGEAFSPSDLVATALGSCMLTLMGIAARTHEIEIEGTKLETTKVMGTDPRRIVRLDVSFTFPAGKSYSDKEKAILEKAAVTCPVYYSLDPAIEKDIQFNW